MKRSLLFIGHATRQLVCIKLLQTFPFMYVLLWLSRVIGIIQLTNSRPVIYWPFFYMKA